MKWVGYICLIFLFASCHKSDTVTVEAKNGTEFCTKDSLHTYQIYFPGHQENCLAMPVVVILDPHGSGSSAMKNFIESAEKFKCILVASNLVRNNMDNYIPSIHLLIEDVKVKYSTEEIYLAGFSGGARMALNYAGTYKMNGVISCGALAHADQIKKINCNVFSIMGLADFNFTEAIPFIIDKSLKPANLNVQPTGEMHNWPSSSDIEFALGNLLLKQDKKKRCINRNEIGKKFSSQEKVKLDSLIAEKSFLNAFLFCENILSIPGFKDTKYFNKKLEELVNSKSLSVEMNNLKKSIQFELKVREAYYNSLTTKEIDWWNNELTELNNQINKGGEKYIVYSYKRIKAFVGILCYSMARNSLSGNDLKTASKILSIYNIVEPENADLAFFKAALEYKTGNSNSAVQNLKDALKKGFTDQTLMKNFFTKEFLETNLVK